MADQRASRLLALSHRLYVLLLRACPAEYRAQYGAPMGQVFRDLAHEAYQRHGAWGIVALWLRLLPDTCSTAIAEHIVNLKERRALAGVELAAAGAQQLSLEGGPAMRRMVWGVMALAVAAAGTLLAAGIYRPAAQYEAGTISPGGGAALAAQAVEDALLRAGHLPLPGTGLIWRQGSLEWENIPQTAPQILEISIRRVRLASQFSLLASLLDDDPVYNAEVEATVITSDGRETALSVTLWDWGLLTPWSFRSIGDGLKPVRVQWT